MGVKRGDQLVRTRRLKGEFSTKGDDPDLTLQPISDCRIHRSGMGSQLRIDRTVMTKRDCGVARRNRLSNVAVSERLRHEVPFCGA